MRLSSFIDSLPRIRRPWFMCCSSFRKSACPANDTQAQLFESNKTLAAYADQKRMVDARSMFDTMPLRNVVSWTVMIFGYVRNDEAELAFELYEKMQWEGVYPSDRTYVGALKACGNLAPAEGSHQAEGGGVTHDVPSNKARSVHCHMVMIGSESNVFVLTTLVDAYAKLNCMQDALYVFEKSPCRTVVSWNAFICSYVQRRNGPVALDLYARLRQECIIPDDGTFVNTLKACSLLATHEEHKEAALEKGRILHHEIVVHGFESYLFVGTSLVDMYAKCGTMRDAQITFVNLQEQDVVSWNVMILGYANEQGFEQALGHYWSMQQVGMLPNHETFLGIFKSCSMIDANWKVDYKEIGRSVHMYGIKRGLAFDGLVGTSLMDMYAKWGSLEDAHCCFEKFPCRDVVAWSAMILGYAKDGNGAAALKFYTLMQEGSVKADDRSFVAALKACCALAAIDRVGKSSVMWYVQNGHVVHMQVLEGGFETDIYVGNALLDMYAHYAFMDDARNVFETMPRWDVTSWSTMISGYANREEGDLALGMYAHISWEHALIDDQTFVAALKACCTLSVTECEKQRSFSSLEKGQVIHSHLIECGFEADPLAGSSLVVMYASCGSMHNARSIYDKLPHADALSCSAMISGCAEEEVIDEALELYAKMQNQGLSGDALIFASIVKGCSQASLLSVGKEIHGQICKLGCEVGSIMETTLMGLYAKCGDMVDASYFLGGMAVRSVTVWNTLIMGYSYQGNSSVAFSLFERMRSEGMEPDGVTLLGILKVL